MNRSICLFVVFLLAVSCIAEGADAITEKDEVDKTIQKAIDYLISRQSGDGSICDVGKNQTAMTALGIMAMCAVGHMPTDQTREGKALHKALEFILRDDRVEENGYFGKRDGSRMYGHGIITLTLAELLGMGVDRDQDRRIRQRLEKAIKLILWSQDRKNPNNQHEYGGWRYEPNVNDSDLSVTIWHVLALRAAKNCSLDVPKSAIDKAIIYLKRCYRSKVCAYQPGGAPTYTSASYGLLALQVCGEYESQEVRTSADWLMERKLDYNKDYFFYGTYYYAQGMYQRGGKYAEHAKQNVEKILLKKQGGDGSWQPQGQGEKNAGKVYSTAMAVLALSVQYHYLPIYQR